ncbi:glycine-N-acyltransferase like 1 [Homo sapiens]|uniref:Glycine-N-acyltransferase like 1 n=1 Tax=Homo sapiens TaxID=9606 RepID=E9PP95_HUMAN|nr:glycine-N-acyltransferase like 1 [Homo sapiens]KAI4071436.1 glycine-N-acyltransferase like 1 [Homo sapiens]
MFKLCSNKMVSQEGSEVELLVSPGARSEHGRYLQDPIVSIDLSEWLRIIGVWLCVSHQSREPLQHGGAGGFLA